jgi:hypothetical protein
MRTRDDSPWFLHRTLNHGPGPFCSDYRRLISPTARIPAAAKKTPNSAATKQNLPNLACMIQTSTASVTSAFPMPLVQGLTYVTVSESAKEKHRDDIRFLL